MKKILIVLLSLIVTFNLIGCVQINGYLEKELFEKQEEIKTEKNIYKTIEEFKSAVDNGYFFTRYEDYAINSYILIQNIENIYYIECELNEIGFYTLYSLTQNGKKGIILYTKDVEMAEDFITIILAKNPNLLEINVPRKLQYINTKMKYNIISETTLNEKYSILNLNAGNYEYNTWRGGWVNVPLLIPIVKIPKDKELLYLTYIYQGKWQELNEELEILQQNEDITPII